MPLFFTLATAGVGGCGDRASSGSRQTAAAPSSQPETSRTARASSSPRATAAPSSVHSRAPASGPLGEVSEVAVGDEATCFLSADRRVRCAGWIFEETLPRNPPSDDPNRGPPRRFPEVHDMGFDDAIGVAEGWGVGCAIHANRSVSCWGRYGRYSMIHGDDARSVRTIDGVAGVAQIALGLGHLCALDTQGAVSCWGSPQHGVETGAPVPDDATRPTRVEGLEHVTALATGSFHTCALDEQGRVRCFGLGDAGELGDGAKESSGKPVDVVGLANVVQIAANHFHTCAVTAAKQVWCWGEEESTELGGALEGAGAPRIHEKPARVAAYDGATEVAVGFDHTCALFADGSVSCAGSGSLCQLGREGFVQVDVAKKVEGLPPAKHIRARYHDTCALLETGDVRCWGMNSYGALGVGRTSQNPKYPDMDEPVCTPSEPRTESAPSP